jgi:transposase
MAVTKQGIPVRCWVFSGETADVSIVKQVKQDLNGWRLGRVISVMDRGFASEDNFVTLQSGGGHYIMGEKMRSGQREVVAALAKAGRFKQLGADLYAKESVVGEGERRVRYVIVLNPQEAEKDKALRQRHLEVLQKKLAALGNLEGKAHTKAVCALVSHRTYGRYLRTRGNGRLEINSAVIRAEEKLDGKYLLRTSDDTLSVEDIVLGYKQLLIIERGFRTLKTDLELRPVYHRKSGRIKAHVLICWLALLLLRVAELETDQSWFHVARALKKLSLVAMQIPEGVVHQTSTPTAEHKRLYARCHLNLPPEVVRVDV